MSCPNSLYYILVVTLISIETLFSFIRIYDQKITKYMKDKSWEVIKIEILWILWSSIKGVVAIIGLIPIVQEYPLPASIITLVTIIILVVYSKVRDKERGYITR